MKSGDNGLYEKITISKIKKIQEEKIMYNYLDTLRRPYIDIMIEYLNRIQLGYSDLIVFAMENGWSEEIIIADIEDMVRKCLDDENVNTIKQKCLSCSSETEAYIKKISHDIFWRLKILNNY